MKKISKIILLLISIFSTNGCNDTLEIDPPGFPSVEEFYKTADEVEAGINGIYQIFQGDWWGGAFVHIHPHFEAVTENAVVCCSWEYGITAIANGTMNATSGGFVAWKWDYGYQAITRANQVMEATETLEPEGMSEDLVKELEDLQKSFFGEIRFLRAYVYAELSFLYGDVPLVLSTISAEEARQFKRTPKAQVVEAVLEDLDFAIDNLGTEPRNGEFGRPTKQAALALKGKVLLYNNRYEEAAATLQQVIDMEGAVVALDPDYESLFRGANEQSKEILFSVQYVGQEVGSGEGSFIQTHYAPNNLDGTSASSGQGWGSFFYTRKLLDDYYMADGQDISTSLLYDENEPFKNRDPRFKMTFFTPGDTYRGVVLDSTNFMVNGVASRIPMAARKWATDTDNINWAANSSADLVVMRYADVLMMYAEAQNEAVGPDASVYAAVNKIRDRVEMPDFPEGLSKEEMRNEIKHERKIEFMMEGHRYFDLLRWRDAETVIPSIPNDENRKFDSAKNYLWPIPQSEIDQNQNITQNPGY